MNKKTLFFLLIIVAIALLIPLVSSLNLGVNGDIGVDLTPDKPINFSSFNVTNAIFWDGNAWSDTRWLDIDGGNANQNIDIGDYNFYAGDGDFYDTGDNTTVTIHSGSVNLNASLIFEEGDLSRWRLLLNGLNNNFYLWNDIFDVPTIETNLATNEITLYNNTHIHGDFLPTDTLTYDIGSGAKRIAVGYFQNISSDYINNAYDITANNFIGSGANLTDLNVTGVMNVSGDFTGYAINISFLQGSAGIGGMDLRGDPWYLAGTDLEIANNLDVDGNLNVDGQAQIDGNLTVDGNISATYLFGDGSQLTGIESGIWENVSGVASYYDDVNITGDTNIEGILNVENIEVSGNPLNPAFYYADDLKNGNSPSIIKVLLNISSAQPSAPLGFEVAINGTTSASSTTALVVNGKLDSYQTDNKIQTLEGARFTFDSMSAIQTTGTRNYKGVNNVITNKANTGGTTSITGLYNEFPTFTAIMTNPIIKRYGTYNTFTNNGFFLNSAGSYEEYGMYSKSAPNIVSGGTATAERWGIYLEGYDKGASETSSYAIEVKDGSSKFDDVNITDDLNIVGNLIIEGNLSAKRPYGMFSSNTSQIVDVANTVKVMNFSHIEDNYLMTLDGHENITMLQSGDYKIDLSVVIVTDTNNKHFNIFPQINGINVPRSNTRVEIENAGTEQVIAVPFILDLDEGDNFRIMYTSDDAGSMTVWTAGSGSGANAIPETPSIIMTIAKISEITD
jgi:hypothetical protein